MNSLERYLFDLHGYLVVPNALDKSVVSQLNEILDTRIEQRVEDNQTMYRFEDLLNWGQPYVDLIDQHSIMPYVEEIVGTTCRLDHVYLDLIRQGLSPIGANLHGGAIPLSATHYFHHHNGRFQNGLTVVAYNLADVNPNDGGFACVPGSHKSNFVFPDAWKNLEQPHPCVQRVTAPAGSAIIFTEALTHGPLPWHGKHERRTIFYKYSPHSIAWIEDYPQAENYKGLTDNQRDLMEAPNARYATRSRTTKQDLPSTQDVPDK